MQFRVVYTDGTSEDITFDSVEEAKEYFHLEGDHVDYYERID
jgi:hypothetical protein